MKQYYFLFIIALIWVIFAVVKDIKKREVPNWLNFSLIAFAIAYRAFYSISANESMFLISGLAGFILFFALAHAFYYLKVFAGGDAKLLMGFGVILPYDSLGGLAYLGIIFLIALFLFGSIYSLIYSFSIALKNRKKFAIEFKKRIRKSIIHFIILIMLSIIIALFNPSLGILISSFLILTLLLYSYVKSLDICMIKLTKPKDLTEGDWLEQDVKIGSKIIKKSVHGLSLEEIKLLKKANKKVLIKEGIPFTPAFLLALLSMAPFFLISKFSYAAFSPF